MTPINPSGLWKKRLGDWVLNPRTGCSHGCRFCYCPAMPGVKFMNGGRKQREWGTYVMPKAGLVAALRNQLRRFTPDKAKTTEWGNGYVLMSFLTDPYVPEEARDPILRECLKLLLEAGHKVRLQTRSALVERDFDLLAAHRDQVLLGTSLPHLDDNLARVLEPGATGPTRRLKMLEAAVDRGLSVYVCVAPFLPFHDEATLAEVLRAIEPLKPREVFCEVLNPKGENLGMVQEALAESYPSEAAAITAYTPEQWAKFTFRVLSRGLKSNDRFIAWPDTQRLWRTHLAPAEVDLLTRHLPPAEDSDHGNNR